MVDILFCAHGRPEFTRASLKALVENTPHGHAIAICSDGESFSLPDPAIGFFESGYRGGDRIIDTHHFGGPVACLNHCVTMSSSEFIAKIDNDTIVPPGWLDVCLEVMRRYPGVDLLGIESWTPDERLFPRWAAPWICGCAAETKGSTLEGSPFHGLLCKKRTAPIPRPVSHIGGIGLFRRRAFERYGLPTPDGRFGFSEWQWKNAEMVKAFIDPPLPAFLLDHLPFDPWLSLSAKYEAEGIQRPHGWLYDAENHKGLWQWWKP